MAYKLLLADDSITIQKVVELVLAEEDFEIKSVSNGEDALNIIGAYNPDIVLADIEMPKINGYQLCEKIKQNPRTAGVPVILLAGAFEPIDEELARKVGADDSVIKPFESQELISKINAALTMVASGEEVTVAEAGEEAFEIAEEAEVAESEEGLDVSVEEDLWAMEEVPAVPEELAAEAAGEEELLTEEEFELQEEAFGEEPVLALREVAAPEVAAAGVVMPQVPREAVAARVVMPEVVMPSKEELMATFQKTIQERVSATLSTADIKEAILASMMPSLKDSIDKILWEVAPELVEKTLREVLKTSMSSLSKEVEKVIWETVPDLASTLISKEIERIKSEY